LSREKPRKYKRVRFSFNSSDRIRRARPLFVVVSLALEAATEMKNGHFAWKGIYGFTEPRINAEGVTLYPFDPLSPSMSASKKL
jgi:hypothetical protein